MLELSFCTIHTGPSPAQQTISPAPVALPRSRPAAAPTTCERPPGHMQIQSRREWGVYLRQRYARVARKPHQSLGPSVRGWKRCERPSTEAGRRCFQPLRPTNYPTAPIRNGPTLLPVPNIACRSPHNSIVTMLTSSRRQRACQGRKAQRIPVRLQRQGVLSKQDVEISPFELCV